MRQESIWLLRTKVGKLYSKRLNKKNINFPRQPPIIFVLKMQDPKKIVSTAVPGMLALLINQFLLRFLSIFSGIILARWLTPEIFGVFAICSFLLAIIGNFSDVGFGLGLVRSSKDPSAEVLQVYFSFQLLLVGALSSSLVFFSYPIGTFLGLPHEDIWVLKIFVFFVFLNIVSAPSQIILQRRLAFGVLARIQTVGIATGQIVAIIAAVSGFGIESLVMGNAFSTIIRIIQIRLVEPFPIGLNVNFKLLKPFLVFGLAGQGTDIILSMQKHIGSAVVGSLQGVGSAGYLNWAWSYTTLPNDLIGCLRRANFSTFSRLQDNKIELAVFSKQIIRSFFLLGLPCTLLLVFWVIPIIEVVYTSKWIPSITAVYALVVYTILRFLIDPIIGLFLSLGHSKKILVLTCIWFLTTLLISIPLVSYYDFSGMGIGYSLGAFLMSIFLIVDLSKKLNINILYPVRDPIIAGIAMALFLFGLTEISEQNWLLKIAMSFLGCGVFFGILLLIDFSTIKKEISHGILIIKKLRHLKF